MQGAQEYLWQIGNLMLEDGGLLNLLTLQFKNIYNLLTLSIKEQLKLGIKKNSYTNYIGFIGLYSLKQLAWIRK